MAETSKQDSLSLSMIDSLENTEKIDISKLTKADGRRESEVLFRSGTVAQVFNKNNLNQRDLLIDQFLEVKPKEGEFENSIVRRLSIAHNRKYGTKDIYETVPFFQHVPNKRDREDLKRALK